MTTPRTPEPLRWCDDDAADHHLVTACTRNATARELGLPTVAPDTLRAFGRGLLPQRARDLMRRHATGPHMLSCASRRGGGCNCGDER